MAVAVKLPNSFSNGERPYKRQRREQLNEPTKDVTSTIISSSSTDPVKDMVRRIQQSNCVELTSMLFDLYGYAVIIPKLSKVYSGSMPINDWYADVSRYVKLNYQGEKLDDQQDKLVQSVQKIATSRYGGLTDQQWRSLLCLNIRIDKRYDSTKMQQIPMVEVRHVEELAMTVLEGKQQATVLALVQILEKYANKTVKDLEGTCNAC